MLRATILLLAYFISFTSMALHLDVAVSNDNGKLKTDFCLETGPACDELPVLVALGIPPFTVPVDIETGNNIFVSDFEAVAINLNGTSEPGFISGSTSQLPAGLRLRYRAVGNLKYWDPVSSEWIDNVPGTTRIKLSGGLEIVTDPAQCGGSLFCILPGNTFFTEAGVVGDASLIVGDTNGSGSLHVHLDWFIEDGAGNPGGPVGAYMVEIQLIADGMQDSDPFYVMFSKGLTTEQFAAALTARIVDENIVPIPFGFLVLLGVLLPLITMRVYRHSL